MSKSILALGGYLSITLFFLMIPLLIIIPFTFWTDRNLDFLFTLIKHTPTDIPLWLSFVITVCGNGVVFVFNIVMELYRFL